MFEYAPPRSQTRVNSSRRGRKVGASPYSGPAGSPRRAVQADGSVSCEANETLVSVFCPSGGAPDGAKCGPGHVGEPGGVVVQTEGGDPEPVDVMRRGRDVVLGESISAETGVNQRPAPPTPKVTIGKTIIGNAYGALVAWVALLIIVNVPVLSGLAAVGAVSSWSSSPRSICCPWYRPTSTVTLRLWRTRCTSHPPRRPPAHCRTWFSPSFANPLVLLIVSMVIGALFGYASD